MEPRKVKVLRDFDLTCIVASFKPEGDEIVDDVDQEICGKVRELLDMSGARDVLITGTDDNDEPVVTVLGAYTDRVSEIAESQEMRDTTITYLLARHARGGA